MYINKVHNNNNLFQCSTQIQFGMKQANINYSYNLFGGLSNDHFRFGSC